MAEDYEATLDSVRDQVEDIWQDYDAQEVASLDAWLREKTTSIIGDVKTAEGEMEDAITERDGRISGLEERVAELEHEVTELEAAEQ